VILPANANSVVGNIGLSKIEHGWELGVIIDRAYWGSALSNEAILLALEFAFQLPDVDLVMFKTRVDNRPMRGFLKTLGIEPSSQYTTSWRGGPSHAAVDYHLQKEHWPTVGLRLRARVDSRLHRPRLWNSARAIWFGWRRATGPARNFSLKRWAAK
jgi:RimJ/RimL family protein N-acetyltransferase